MESAIARIGFSATEDWSVEDFYSFFHQLNILYNRLLTLDGIIARSRPVKLKSALHSSLSRIDEGSRLQIQSIEIHSPGDFNLLGVDKIIAQLRALFRDISYANRLDRQAKKESLRHQQAMHALEENALAQKLLAEQVRLMQSVGFSDEDIRSGVKALLDPLQKLQELSARKHIRLKEPQ